MNEKKNTVLLLLLAAATLIIGGILLYIAAVPVLADSTDCVIALGEDLKENERAAVLKELGLTEADLEKNTVVTVTNAQEHEYLGSYLPPEVIGTRALSSCKVMRGEEGTGIQVETHNINYCTAEMYQNALATAGVKNAKVVVAGPFSISGTAALVGALKAYETQEDIHIKPENFDVSTSEIVTTSQLGESLKDSKKAAELIAAVKQIVAEKNLTDEEAIGKVIDEICAQLEITLTEDERQAVIKLMIKVSKLDIDVESLTKQAGDVYQELKNQGIDLSQYGITESDVNGFLGFFVKLWRAIMKLFGR